MKWYSVSFALLAMLGSGLAYGEQYNPTGMGGTTRVRSVLRTPVRQASIRRSTDASGPTIVEPGDASDDSPAALTNTRTTGSGATGAARRIFAGNVKNSFNNTNNLGDPAEATGAYDAGPGHAYVGGPTGNGFVGGCCDDTKPCCNHLWDGFCDEKNCDCPNCDSGRGKCKKSCCRKPKCYRQDLFTWLKNQRAMKQAECGCESECDSCGQAPCNCGGGHAGGSNFTHPHAGKSIVGENSPSDAMDAPAAPPPEELDGPGEAASEVPPPADENGQLEAPGNERAAMRRLNNPRRGYTPVQYRGN